LNRNQVFEFSKKNCNFYTIFGEITMNKMDIITIFKDKIILTNLFIWIVGALFALKVLYKKGINICSWNFLWRIVFAFLYIFAMCFSGYQTYRNQKKQSEQQQKIYTEILQSRQELKKFKQSEYSKDYIISTLKMEIKENILILDRGLTILKKELEFPNESDVTFGNPQLLITSGWDKIKVNAEKTFSKDLFSYVFNTYHLTKQVNNSLNNRELLKYSDQFSNDSLKKIDAGLIKIFAGQKNTLENTLIKINTIDIK